MGQPTPSPALNRMDSSRGFLAPSTLKLTNAWSEMKSPTRRSQTGESARAMTRSSVCPAVWVGWLTCWWQSNDCSSWDTRSAWASWVWSTWMLKSPQTTTAHSTCHSTSLQYLKKTTTTLFLSYSRSLFNILYHAYPHITISTLKHYSGHLAYLQPDQLWTKYSLGLNSKINHVRRVTNSKRVEAMCLKQPVHISL